MRISLLHTALLATTVFSFGADDPVGSSGENAEATPICLTANQMSTATGQPSLVLMSNGSVHIPVWSLSGGTVGQSVSGLVGSLPGNCRAVKVEIVVTTTEAAPGPDLEDVYRVHLSQMVEGASFTERYRLGTPVRTPMAASPLHTRTILLESYYEVVPNAPLWVRIQREPGDAADTFTKPTGLAMVKVTPVQSPAQPHVVQDVKGYNSWPMLQAIGNKLVCVYSRGSAHTINEDARAVYARTSTDGGKTWTAETVVANTPGYGEVDVGKGLDSDGAMLLWVRRIGKGEWDHDLYRTTDGVTFTLVTTPELSVRPMQITDIFTVPKIGLMALWFAGDYGDKPTNAWGIMTSSDNGATWAQTTVESELPKNDWPTEPAAVYLGDGKILAIARSETGPAQFQIVSTDYGKTWKREPTNIGDIMGSTPSLVLDAKTGLLSNYHFHRGKGFLRRRVVDPQKIFDDPRSWPGSEVVAIGSTSTWDTGNANATVIGDTHYISFYSGKAPDTSVLVSELPAPSAKKPPVKSSSPDQSAKR
ncbi:MAG: sialidase family protein [Verrucomicrobiota bacterium]